MNRKRMAALVCSIILLASLSTPALAALNEGGFIPCSTEQNVSTESGLMFYQIKKGDTLWDISRNFNVDLQTIIAINNLNKKSVLSIGQTLEIPYNRARVYNIRAGDTLWDIAVKYDISVEDIKAANPNKNPRNLKIGDKLIIPDSRSARLAVAIPSRGSSYGEKGLLWPVVGAISSAYGWRKSGFHHGIDIVAKSGTAIKAAAAGKVTCVAYQPVYGNMVIIKHPDGKETAYAHASKIYVKENQYVSKGQTIAAVGVSGRTTGAHLHFEVRINGKPVNPQNYL